MKGYRGAAGAVLGVVIGAASVWAGPVWEGRTGNLPETDIRAVAPAAGGETVLAASPRQLYRYLPETQSWKRVLGVRRPDEVVEIAAEPRNSRVFWLVTHRTLRRSADGGRTWKIVFRRDSESDFRIRTAVPDGAGGVLAGTTQGLYRLRLPEGQWASIEGSPKNTSVDSIVQTTAGEWIIGTARGIYRADRAFTRWELLKADLRRESSEDGALGQFAVEEIAAVPALANAVAWPKNGAIYLGRTDGVYETTKDSVNRLAETDGLNIRHLAADERFVYLATDRGVYRMVPETHAVENVSQGLQSLEVSTISADPSTGAVWAGTPKGLFRLDVAEPVKIPAPPAVPGVTPVDPVEAPFSFTGPAGDPTVADVQLAAIRYAEVSPEKIQAWRDAAARRAWLPKVSFDTDFGEDHNVDIDRGGTNDPDRFIVGPNETNIGWSIGVSWDLADLIWNGDQTLIDVRSRLMVELRNDILNDVTHLYFERRRLQAEMASLPPDVPKLRFEKELKLQELTAQIDALTGGYMSRQLNMREGRT